MSQLIGQDGGQVDNGNLIKYINDNLNPLQVAKFISDNTGVSLIGIGGAKYATLGTSIITAGSGGKYSTLQAAMDYALTQTHWTDTALAGTITVTNGSRVVTGSGTAFIAALAAQTHISITTGGARKYYGIDSVRSDTVIVLTAPYQETTAASQSCVSATQIFYQINVLSDGQSGTISTIGNDVNANIIIDFMGHSSGAISYNLKSGHLELINSPYISTIHAYGAHVGDLVLDRLSRFRNDPVAPADWFQSDATAYHGRVFAKNLRAQGNFDLFMPSVIGHLEVQGCWLRSVPDNETDVSTANQAISSTFKRNGATANFIGNTFISACYGAADSRAMFIEGLDNITSLPTTGHEVNVVDCNIILEKVSGSTENTNSFGLRLGISSSTVTLTGGGFSYIGSPTPGAAWRSISAEAGMSGNTVNVRGTRLLDLQSVTTNAAIGTLTGDRGTHVCTIATNAITAAQLDALRGSVFTATLNQNITSIASVSNAPDGTEITFILTQDGTGGWTVGWAAAYKFLTAWSNTGNTLGKISSVTFKKTGTSWIQTSAANAWV